MTKLRKIAKLRRNLSRVTVVFYTADGIQAPVLDWIHTLTRKAQDKCTAWLELLSERGHELRRPYADYLDKGIYELRIITGGSQIRILYFFHGGQAVVLTNGFVKKQDKVPKREMELAFKRRTIFETDPKLHSYVEEK